MDNKEPKSDSDDQGDLNSSTESGRFDEKRARVHTPTPESASNNDTSGSTFNVPASPPRYVSMNEVMKAAQAVSNLNLAHQIATDEQFKVVPKKSPEKDSLESRVTDMMHKAFWDTLRNKLEDNPPDYSFALSLLSEIKQSLFDLLLPQHKRIHNHIDSILDLSLIQQQVENNALDFNHYAVFIISIMEKFCAPVRDKQVQSLREIKDIPDLFKEIFSVLDLMKMDMANFTIQQIRPFVQQQSVDYEKQKFNDLLKQQEDNNLDGLEHTKAWLQSTADHLFKDAAANKPEPQTDSASGGSPAAPTVPTVTPNVIMNTAYSRLLSWDQKNTYPETLLMDKDRLTVMSDAIIRLSCVSSVILVTYNTAGACLASNTKFKSTLKDQILIIIGDVPLSELNNHMLNVSDIVLTEVSKLLKEQEYNPLSEAQGNLIKDQILHIMDPENPVYNIINTRITGFFKDLISAPKPESIRFPAGVSCMASELSSLGGHFLRLVSHNRAVFGGHYAGIISTILKTRDFYAQKNRSSESEAENNAASTS